MSHIADEVNAAAEVDAAVEMVGDGPFRPPEAVGKQTLEDYTLRFAPRSYRRWSTGVVAISAL